MEGSEDFLSIFFRSLQQDFFILGNLERHWGLREFFNVSFSNSTADFTYKWTRMRIVVSVSILGNLELHWTLSRTVGSPERLGKFFKYSFWTLQQVLCKNRQKCEMFINFHFGQSRVQLGSFEDHSTSWKAWRIFSVFFSSLTIFFVSRQVYFTILAIFFIVIYEFKNSSPKINLIDTPPFP